MKNIKNLNLKSLIQWIPIMIVVVLLMISIPTALKRHIKFSRPGYYFDNTNETLYYRYYSNWFIYVNADWEEMTEDPKLNDFEHTYTYNSLKWPNVENFKDSEAYRKIKESVLSIDFNSIIKIDSSDLKPYIIFNDDVLNVENYE